MGRAEHDPLCPTRWGLPCQCDLTQRVRADERERIAQDIEQHGADLPYGVISVPFAARIARDGGGDE